MGKILTLISATILLLGACFTSCNNSECFDNQSTIPLAGFYSMQTKSKITVDSLTIYGVDVPGDSILLNNGSVSSLYIPMPLSGSKVDYVFHYNSKALDYIELNDTLSINYNSYPQFVSNECGAIYKYDITGYKYTNHLIDSIALPTMEFNNVDTEVIKIYFRTEN